MEISTDHYRVLNLPSDENSANLTEKDISRAYKKMALKLHPDKNPKDPNAHFNFQKLLSSYQFLKNPKSRKEFDRLLQINRQREKMDFDFRQQRKKQEEKQQAKNPKASKTDFNFQQQSKKQEERQQAKNPKASKTDFNFQQQSKKQEEKKQAAAKDTQPTFSDILKELTDILKELKWNIKIIEVILLIMEIKSLIKEAKESEVRRKIDLLISLIEEILSLIKETKLSEDTKNFFKFLTEEIKSVNKMLCKYNFRTRNAF